MVTFLSSTRWTSEQPAIYLTGEYEQRGRTATTVQIRVKLTVSAVTGNSYFGYNIRYRLALAGSYMNDWVTIKGNSPSQWSSPYVVYSEWYEVSARAENTTVNCTIYMDTNGGKRTTSYSEDLTIPTGNTAPYWPSGAGARFNRSGIIADNVSSVTYSWDRATDREGNTILYKAEVYRNGSYYSTIKNETTSCSFTLDPRTILSEGQSMFIRVYCRDANTAYSSYVQTNTITRNKLTQASITSVEPIRFDTVSFNVVRSDASNTNGSSSFTYALSGLGVPVYNGTNVTSLGRTITVQVWRSGAYPTGPYVKFPEIQEYVKNSQYTGSLPLTLTTTNAYSTLKTSAAYPSVNLQMDPSVSTITSITGTRPINGVEYCIINRQALTLEWDEAVDPNGTAVTYTVQSSAGGVWADVASGLTLPSYTYGIRNVTSSQKIKFRIIAKSAYGKQSTGPESNEITLDYYNAPVLSDLRIDRETDRCILKWKYTQNSSIDRTLYTAAFTVKNKDNAVTVAQIDTGDAATGQNEYEVTLPISGLEETTTYPFTIECTDTVAATFNLTPAAISGVLPRYSALLSIREKGVGINAVAGDFADIIMKGATSMHGGDAGTNEIGALNFSVAANKNMYWYQGAYVDAEGKLRAAQDIAPFQYHTQLRFSNVGYTTGSTGLESRYWYTDTNVIKDAEITGIHYGGWYAIPTLNYVQYLDTQVKNDTKTVMGSNSNGSYAKFPDGLLICWGLQDFGTHDITTAWGLLYETDTLTFKPFPTAVPFIDVPSLTVSAHCTGWTFLIEGMKNTTRTEPGSFWAIRPDNVALSVPIIASYIAIGRWK